MKKQLVTLLAVVCMLAAAAFPQNPATSGSFGGRYGMSAWAINNQRVASQFNYDIDSSISQGAALALYSFPAATCQQALGFGGARNVNPFNTNAQ